MTLRQLLHAVDLDKVYEYINTKDCDMEPKTHVPTLDQTIAAYTPVVEELMKKPKVRRYSMDILVQETEDWFDHHKYADVCLLNRKYVAPKKGLKPWGGKNPPAGHYNCNLSKHNRTFAIGFTPWSKIIDTPVVNKAGYDNERVFAEILWELTFYGWTEAKVEKKTTEIKGKLDQSLKEIKQGKCIELPPKKEGGFKVVIPDCVSQQIIDIANKKSDKPKVVKKKCNTCWGFGLWGIGDACPMGPMDASDGMPTKACPECGANPNPIQE